MPDPQHAPPSASSPEDLRTALVDGLRDRQIIRTRRVEDAFRAVPRHLFLPEVPVETAYTDDAVVTKQDPHGNALSSASAPWLVATMLEDGQVKPGERVLEIGAGTGYNAALLAHLVGATGAVTTIDIDPDCVTHAQKSLATTGYGDVRVICGDGAHGARDHAPFNLVIVTVGATDLAPAWLNQATADGRLVVPLRLRGLSYSIVFERDGGHWRSTSMKLCGFVPMQGEGALRLDTAQLADGVRLRIDDGQSADTPALATAFTAQGHEVWTGIPLGGNEGALPKLDWWLATALDTYGRIHTTPEAVARGTAGWTPSTGASATWDTESFAYITIRGEGDSGPYEIGTRAHGPESQPLAEHLAEQVRIWDREHRHGPGPVITAHPAGTPDDQLPTGRVIERRHNRIVITWP